MADRKLNLNIKLGEIQHMEAISWHYWLSIRVHNSETPNNGSNMAEQNNKKKNIRMKFSTPRFSRSLMLKLEMQ